MAEEGCCCLPLPRRRSRCSARHLLTSRQPCKVLLYPEEGWARSAMSSYWILAPCWWSWSRCKVIEVTGTRRFTTKAQMISSDHSLCIIGSFKKMNIDPDFKLSLTSNVTMADFNMGYMMTGSLERGHKKKNSYQTTHFAIIQRTDFSNS
ncbi:uncharacterized protein LOC128991183 [Macrosteles quadrilineatus]|uniref:uncharacterized protein LOC128988376 n=1 Tax=Macrosteles quadrilineatus TaxID=74068 RepID=UPI0023E16E12|nr:uncharacterized protein LOC128988376 [Macrosteles quadrilineatus]XP_054269941.1 uncharacterized protein LOC128991183 [Macrosteles quadrilineatus]